MIDYIELKRLAEAATPGRVHDRLDSCGGGLKYECFGDDGSLVLKVDHKNDEWGFIGDRGAEDEAFFLACTPAVVLGLIAEIETLCAISDLQKLLPEVDDALEELEMHGQHSDQGYHKLRDWYRKVELAYRVIAAPMFGADHAELVSQNTWLRKMVGHQAEQHAPMEPIDDPEGWSRRLPGYDLPALLRDAERYRYLRDGAYSFENSRRELVAIEDLDAPKEQFPSGAEMLDAAVDIAMSKESGHD